jgi:hypothetical protein
MPRLRGEGGGTSCAGAVSPFGGAQGPRYSSVPGSPDCALFFFACFLCSPRHAGCVVGGGCRLHVSARREGE